MLLDVSGFIWAVEASILTRVHIGLSVKVACLCMNANLRGQIDFLGHCTIREGQLVHTKGVDLPWTQTQTQSPALA